MVRRSYMVSCCARGRIETYAFTYTLPYINTQIRLICILCSRKYIRTYTREKDKRSDSTRALRLQQLDCSEKRLLYYIMYSICICIYFIRVYKTISKRCAPVMSHPSLFLLLLLLLRSCH